MARPNNRPMALPPPPFFDPPTEPAVLPLSIAFLLAPPLARAVPDVRLLGPWRTSVV